MIMPIHDLVEVKYKGGKKWYRGIIEKFESSGKYVIKYCLDGEIETNVKRKSIWYVGKEQEEKENEVSYEVGDAIFCRHNRGVRYFPGKIEKILPGAINLMWYTTMGIKKKVWNDGFFESPELNIDVHIDVKMPCNAHSKRCPSTYTAECYRKIRSIVKLNAEYLEWE